VKVGDIMLVKDKEILPCDVLILGTSEENGQCFCQTATLDGERTLKSKRAPKQTQELFQGKDEPSF